MENSIKDCGCSLHLLVLALGHVDQTTYRTCCQNLRRYGGGIAWIRNNLVDGDTYTNNGAPEKNVQEEGDVDQSQCSTRNPETALLNQWLLLEFAGKRNSFGTVADVGLSHSNSIYNRFDC